MDGYLDQQVPYTLANVRMDVNFQCVSVFVCVLLSPPVRFYVSLSVCFGESASRPARVFVPKQPQPQQQQKQKQKQQLCARYKKILHNFTQICNKVQQSNAFGDVCERGLFCGTVWLNVRQMVTFFRRKNSAFVLFFLFSFFFWVSFNRNASTAERCVVVAAADSCEAL